MSGVIDARKAIITIDKSWNQKTEYVSLAEFTEMLDAIAEDKDVMWASKSASGNSFGDRAEFDFPGNPKTGTRHPFSGRSSNGKLFGFAVYIGTDDIDTEPDDDTLHQFVEENYDDLREQAIERITANEYRED